MSRAPDLLAQGTSRDAWMNKEPKRLAFTEHGSAVVTGLQFDDDKIVSASDDQTICVYDIRTGALRRRLDGHEGGVWAMQYVDNTLVTTSTDRTVRVWNLETGKCTHVFHGHTSTVRCLQILLPAAADADTSPTPKLTEPLIVTSGRDTTVRVWRLPAANDPEWLPDWGKVDGSPATNPFFRHVLAGHTHSVRAVAGHGHIVCSASYDSTVRVWDVVEGKCLHQLKGHTSKVFAVVYDSVSKCWSGSMDATVRCWDVHTGQCLAVLEGHSSLVGLLDLSPQWLMSAAADATLRMWNPQTNALLHTLQGHTQAVTCFDFDTDKVVSGSEGGIKLWNPHTGKMVRDLVTNVANVWQIQVSERYCVAAVNRDRRTEFLVLDFNGSALTAKEQSPTSMRLE